MENMNAEVTVETGAVEMEKKCSNNEGDAKLFISGGLLGAAVVLVAGGVYRKICRFLKKSKRS